MAITILDCYTDEAAGLGVPPYLGTYPRYLFGKLKLKYPDEEIYYITIDDLRFWRIYGKKYKAPTIKEKTNIRIYNRTKNDAEVVLGKTDELYVVLGVHVPGKYLTALPGTLREVIPLLKSIKCKKILCGPAVFGTQLEGGKKYETTNTDEYEKDYTLFNEPYKTLSKYAIPGAEIMKQIPYECMLEIETGRGCDIGRCSFCTEPIKNKVTFRENKDTLAEIQALQKNGAEHFRLGKQTCFYTIPDADILLKDIRKKCPKIKTLHIDNVNPVKVVRDKDAKITKAIVKYCTEGNIAAFGIESFDMEVVRKNTLNTLPKVGYEAIKMINKYGNERGPNGMPKFLPGINIIFGLMGETKKTHEENIAMLKKIYDEDLMIRRINVRQAAVLPGTKLEEEAGDKFLKKNKKYYWKWRNDIRQKVDFPMLKRLVPEGTILKNVRMEMHDGKTTFGRQMGTYPLIVGVIGRIELNKYYTVKVTKHMLRSITAEVVKEE